MREHNLILVVSFGTSYAETREKTIGAIEQTIAERFPDWTLRRAFTSGFVIRKIRKMTGEQIDSPEEALTHAAEDGFQKVVVLPTHLMRGLEYQKLADTVQLYEDRFASLQLASPLVDFEEDYPALAKAVVERISFITGTDSQDHPDDRSTAFLLMGHGTSDEHANLLYARLQEVFHSQGYPNFYIATVEGTPLLEDVLKVLQSSENQFKRVVLLPLMVVAGDHAMNDMAGDEEGSWKQVLLSEGYEVECILEGLGENPAVREMYVKRLKSVINNSK